MVDVVGEVASWLRRGQTIGRNLLRALAERSTLAAVLARAWRFSVTFKPHAYQSIVEMGNGGSKPAQHIFNA